MTHYILWIAAIPAIAVLWHSTLGLIQALQWLDDNKSE